MNHDQSMGDGMVEKFQRCNAGYPGSNVYVLEVEQKQ